MGFNILGGKKSTNHPSSSSPKNTGRKMSFREKLKRFTSPTPNRRSVATGGDKGKEQVGKMLHRCHGDLF